MTVYKMSEDQQEVWNEEYWEQTGEQLDQLVKSDCVSDREIAACFGRDKDLDILVHDPDRMVRQAVADHQRAKDLDILVHDEDADVLKTVIHAGRAKDLIYLLLNEYDDEVVLYAASVFRRRFGKYTDAYMQLLGSNIN